jgi:Zn-dependent protease with chaperone function
MESKIEYKVSSKENVYFVLKLIISIGLYFLIALFVVDLFSSFDPSNTKQYVILFYVLFIFVFIFFRLGFLIGYIKGNAIRVTRNQFPDIYKVVESQSSLLGLSSVPKTYILQSGGLLNAFATRFMGSNYVVLYSEIVESAYEQDKSILEFIIGHELGHIKRNHMAKRLLLFPSFIIPFLGAAYSRACEYTCDNIGFALAPKGYIGGLLILASGRSIYKKVNLNEYINQGAESEGFWKWFAGKISSHPNLSKRIAVHNTETKSFIKSEPDFVVSEEKKSDHSRFMPN